MGLKRAFAGIIAWQSHVYVFGGNSDPALKEAEKFHTSTKEWHPLPSMHCPRLAFTPLLYRDWFLLISSAQGSTSIETFTPVLETYRRLDLSVDETGYGAISFMREGKVAIVFTEAPYCSGLPASLPFPVLPCVCQMPKARFLRLPLRLWAI